MDRRISDPLEREACDKASQFIAGWCSKPGVAEVLLDLLTERISKEEADKKLVELLNKERLLKK